MKLNATQGIKEGRGNLKKIWYKSKNRTNSKSRKV